jgi:hypothetical protein
MAGLAETLNTDITGALNTLTKFCRFRAPLLPTRFPERLSS